MRKKENTPASSSLSHFIIKLKIHHLYSLIPAIFSSLNLSEVILHLNRNTVRKNVFYFL